MNFIKLVKFLLILSIFQVHVSTGEKDLSIGAKVHVFLLKLIGKHEVVTKKEPKPIRIEYPRHYRPWHTSTLKITTTTVKYPYIIGFETPTVQNDGSIKSIPMPIEEPLNSAIVGLLERNELKSLPAGYFKIYIPTTTATDTTEHQIEADDYYSKNVIRIFSGNKQKA
ncbi:hypothetical protein PVAND_011223 [Polypedilum vanderplanki]|uniref:Gingipain propeptide domain-containing protein n=1 Tax=Polypedilum vanderplanki TaxID=319348 RepID=A0A9J6CIX1_POLVA|nr:hypothetical protein PVAND_011223 [Polypedilum vanderplanki]